MSTNFPTSLDSYSTLVDNTNDVMAAHINNPQDAIEALEAKVGINSSAVTGSLDYKVNNFFATGRKVYLYENTAPTGWSIASVTDKVLAVKSSTPGDVYYVNGGTQAGTWTQPDHTLLTAEMPAHTHMQNRSSRYGDGGSDGNIYLMHDNRTSDANDKATDSTGGDTAHNHGTTYRPYAAVGIIVEKT